MTLDNDKQLPLLAFRLRALVLALGESVLPPWWKTGFMSETGFRFLERLYPRTFVHAAVYSAGKAACDTHDQAVGRVAVYHLFRLSESLEAAIHAIPPTEDVDFFARFRSCLGKPEDLLDMLQLLCAGGLGKDDVAGARRIGTDKDLRVSDTIGETASFYHRAFSLGKPAFPYFAAVENGVSE